MSEKDDLICDILKRIKDVHPEIDHTTLRLIEAGVRRDWGGDRPYISKTQFDRDKMLARDGMIYRDYLKGERLALLSRRYKLSSRRIRQIIQQKAEEAKKIQSNKK